MLTHILSSAAVYRGTVAHQLTEALCKQFTVDLLLGTHCKSCAYFSLGHRVLWSKQVSACWHS